MSSEFGNAEKKIMGERKPGAKQREFTRRVERECWISVPPSGNSPEDRGEPGWLLFTLKKKKSLREIKQSLMTAWALSGVNK